MMKSIQKFLIVAALLLGVTTAHAQYIPDNSIGSAKLKDSAVDLGSAKVTGTLPVSKGGSGLTSGTSGGIPYFSSTSGFSSSAALTQYQLIVGGGAGAAPYSLGALGTSATVLHGNASGLPSFGAVALGTDVSGILPSANGGAGTVSGLVKANGSGVTSAASAGTDYAPATSGASLLYGNGAGGFSNATVGSGLTFSTGTLALSANASGFTSVNPATLVLNGTTSDAIALQDELDRIASVGGGTVKIIAPYGAYIDSVVQETSNTTLDLTEASIIYGASGSIGANGELTASPASNIPVLFSSISAGATSFPIIVKGANVTPTAGQQFTLSGQNDATGRTLNKEVGYIASVVDNGPVSSPAIGEKWTITPVDAVQNSYSQRYTGDDYEIATGRPDNSTFKINDFSALTGDTAAGAMQVTVADGSVFTAGNYVYYADKELESSGGFGTGTNSVNNEVNRILSISSNTLSLEHPTYHALHTANHGGVTKMDPCLNCRIIGGHFTYAAADGVSNRYPLYMKYAVNSEISGNTVEPSVITGTEYGAYGNHIRSQYSYKSRIINNTLSAKKTNNICDSGECYGIVLVGATDGEVYGNTVSNARHDILLQGGAAGNNIFGNTLIGTRVSSIDFHGVNAVYNKIHGNHIIGGPLAPASGTTKTGIRISNPTHPAGDSNNEIWGNLIENWKFGDVSMSGYAIGLSSPAANNRVWGNTIIGCDYGINISSNSTYTTLMLGYNMIDHNYFKGCTNDASVNGGTDNTGHGTTDSQITDLAINDNIFDGGTNHLVVSNADAVRLDGNEIINSVSSSGVYAVKATNIGALKVNQNRFDGTNRGIVIKTSPAAQITRNLFANQLETTVFKDDTSSGNNNGFIFTGNTYTGTSSPVETLGSSTGYTLTEAGTVTTTGTPASSNMAKFSGAGSITNATAGTDYVAPGGALGTPSSGTLTNATGLPISTGVSGLGTGIAAFLATPSSANLASALTDENGSGKVCFADGTLSIASGKTLTASNTLTFTGTDSSSVAFGAGGTVIYSGGALGTPSSGTLTNTTGLPVSTGISGLGANVATSLANALSASGTLMIGGNNLSEVSTPATARTNLGFSTAAVQPTMYVPIHAAANSNLTWTDMPLAETMLNGATGRIQKLDLTNYTQVRMICKVNTAGVSGAKLIARYNTAGSVSGTISGNWTTDLGTSEVACSFGAATGMFDSGWINIAAGAKGDYHEAVVGSGGDGAADPAFGSIQLQFK